MNDGVLAMIIQWCLLCLCWMGCFDRPLTSIRINRTKALAAMMLVLVCAFSNWQLHFFPLRVNVAGVLLPLLFAACLWSVLPREKRQFALICALFSLFCLYMARVFLLWDPILMVWDEKLLLPAFAVLLFFMLSREWRMQLFWILVVFPLADMLFVATFLPKSTVPAAGGEYAQDLLWVALATWCPAALLWGWLTSRTAMLAWFHKLKLRGYNHPDPDR